MARPKRTKTLAGRIDLRADQEWIDLVRAAADRLGLRLSAYIRLATNERLQRDGFVLPPQASTDGESVTEGRHTKNPRGRPQKEKGA